MSMNTNTTKSLAWILLLSAIAGCDKKSETQVAIAAPATSSAMPQEAKSTDVSLSAAADDADLRLNDQFVSPDANSELVADEDAEDDDDSDEDAAADSEALADAFDPLADADSPTAVEVKFVPGATTSILASGRQLAYAQEIEKRNERVRARRLDAEAAQAQVPEAKPPANAPRPPASNTSTQAAQTPTPPPAPIDEKKILNDKHGQWATSASASSTYGGSTAPKAAYSAWQVTGAPNVDRYSDNPLSWTTKAGDSKDPEWLEVGFAKPVHATSIRIRQNAAPGVIGRIELIDDANVVHTMWEGTDDTPYTKDTIGWLVKDFPRTSYVVKGVRITLMTARVWGWNEIDAVQLVGEE